MAHRCFAFARWSRHWVNYRRTLRRITFAIGAVIYLQGDSAAFLERILLELKRHGLLFSRRGRGGGYSLRLEPSAITVDAVLCALERPIDLEPCNPGFTKNQCGDCTNYENCGVHVVLVRVCHAIRTALRETTIADLAGIHSPTNDVTQLRLVELDATAAPTAP